MLSILWINGVHITFKVYTLLYHFCDMMTLFDRSYKKSYATFRFHNLIDTPGFSQALCHLLVVASISQLPGVSD